SQEKLKVIGKGSSNGINTNHFDPECIQISEIQELRHRLGINEGDFVFIYVGRMVRDKGINELLQSFDRLCDLKLDTGSSNEAMVIPKLLLVGYLEQDLDPISPEANNILENNKNILFVGYQGDVRPFYCIS